MRRITVIALSAMLCALLSSVAGAQRLDGTLRVTVMDKSQASIEDAKVTALNEATGVAANTTASSAGTYVFPNLLSGSYTVTVGYAQVMSIPTRGGRTRRVQRSFRGSSGCLALRYNEIAGFPLYGMLSFPLSGTAG